MPVWPLAAILILLAVGSALFSALETAFFSLQPFQLRRLHERNPRLAGRFDRLLENPRRILSALLLADAALNVPLIVLSLFLVHQVVRKPIHTWAMAAGIFAFIALVCDLGPKIFALNQPYRLVKIGTRVLGLLMPVLGPTARLLEQASDAVADIAMPGRRQAPLNQAEWETLVQLSAQEGTLDAAESEMIQEVLKLGDKTVKDCMTPRIDLFSLPDDLTNEEAILRLRAERHRRVPVYGETPDDIAGILDVTRFLLNPGEHYIEQVNPPSFVPETMKALDLLRSFITHKQGLAVIVDEFGGVEGIVTMNDFVEEIISDAVPKREEELYIEPIGEGRVIAAGRTRLDDLAEIGFLLEAEGVDTIGGLIFNRVGSVPRAGARLEIDGVRVQVRRSSRRGVEEVLLEKRALPDGAEEEEDGP